MWISSARTLLRSIAILGALAGITMALIVGPDVYPLAPESKPMNPSINVITLAVDDLDRSMAFYRDGLGLKTRGIMGQQWDDGAVVFFNMNEDLILALYPRKSLAKDAKLPPAGPNPLEFSIGQIVDSKQEVDALLERAARAGARITDRPHERPWGIYSGYFQDPDGHLWEIIWDPRRQARE
jgi:catechol 2,3-dioxygenase-like lactoylglutathione lyase family enzyme